MLCCGECTFLKESKDGLGGLCDHPEKDTPQIDRSRPSKYRDYNDPCRHDFPDIWAARGSARLIWNEDQNRINAFMPPDKVNQIVGMVGQLVGQPTIQRAFLPPTQIVDSMAKGVL